MPSPRSRPFPATAGGIIAAFCIEYDGHRSPAEIARFLGVLHAAHHSSDKVELARTECPRPSQQYSPPQGDSYTVSKVGPCGVSCKTSGTPHRFLRGRVGVLPWRPSQDGSVSL